MAEGWARDWIRRQRQRKRHERDSSATSTSNHDGCVASPLDDDDDISTKVVVASVALDSGAVYKQKGKNATTKTPTAAAAAASCSSCRRDDNIDDDAVCGEQNSTAAPKPQERQQQEERNSVKRKAVEAMAQDGVDISMFYPKTLGEILPLLTVVGDQQNSSRKSAADAAKPIDVLVVLCSCGDEMRQQLSQKSKVVQLWDVPAPTALASKTCEGGGDKAYRRVSLEIRDQVHNLMENELLHHSTACR